MSIFVALAVSVLLFIAWLLSPELAALLGGSSGVALAMMQWSVSVRTGVAASIETTIGTSPIIDFYDADPPANAAAGPNGNLIARGTLPSDWLAAAASGAVGKTGTWTATGVLSGGTARSFRIYRSGSPSECDIQGTVGPTGSPTYDMGVDNVSIANGQVVTVTAFTITIGNA